MGRADQQGLEQGWDVQSEAPLPAACLVHRIDKAPAGFMASLTVAGLARAAPEEVFNFFSNPSQHPAVYSSCIGVEELAWQDGEDGKPQVLEFLTTSCKRVMGKTVKSTMHMRQAIDPTAWQVTYSLLKPSGMVKALSMHNSAVQLPAGGGDSPASEAAAAAVESLLHKLGVTTPKEAKRQRPPQPPRLGQGSTSTGPRAFRLLSLASSRLSSLGRSSRSFLRRSSKRLLQDTELDSPVVAEDPTSACKEEANACSTAPALPESQPAAGFQPCSVVIMHMKIKPAIFCPPIFKGLLARQLLGMLAKDLEDVLASFNRTGNTVSG